MPLYSFRCLVHDKTFDIYQTMDERHEANCPECGNPMKRIYTPSYIPSHPKLGITRQEMFDNLAMDGHMSKDWRATDTYYHRAIGAENGF